ncbi:MULTISPECIES: hypothetical protein [Erwiniaceae]|uniref:Uncharacterized protein n=1 Tax=Pantoea coffeiphila TaxID=1465635 RepID=A0A2S9I9J8_9GAMM|nr:MULTISPECIES: hypothetical protein [Erwiniaceae]MBK0002684.1 hypothetical protein [Erwinia sp. S38]MBM7341393.1 hypothetical protein [Pantoea coffeiphila]PRD14441.1 hypothetical protein CQW29_16430 [Pantoea coffeiphila]
MKNIFSSLFASPESLLQVMSRQDIMESIQEGDRIIVDEDGNVSVNPTSPEVQDVFFQHVQTLKDV